MSIFGKIMSSIFGASGDDKGADFQTASMAPAAPAGGAATTAPAKTAPAAETASPVGAARPANSVDVAAHLDALAKSSRGKLEWRKSIVDLMKLLKLDSSLAARKELAQELGYTGSTKDSAAMNVWLHKQVMTKLAENGGKVPDELKQ